ncbi:MAG: hypothetical protein ACU843_18380 [Gammaproteobacteria bacterium]
MPGRDPASDFLKTLQDIHQATEKKAGLESERREIAANLNRLEDAIREEERACEEARSKHLTAERIQRWESALQQLRAKQAETSRLADRLWSRREQTNRGIESAAAEVGKLQRRARLDLVDFREHVAALGNAYQEASRQIETISTWIHRLQLGIRSMERRAAGSNQSKWELGSDYAEKVYKVERNDTYLSLGNAVVGGTKDLMKSAGVTGASGLLKALARSVTGAKGDLAALGLQGSAKTVLKTLLGGVKSNAADFTKIGNEALRERYLFGSPSDLSEDIVAYSPEAIDVYARGPLRRAADGLYIEPAFRASFDKKLLGKPGEWCSRTRGGYQSVEDDLVQYARQELYFRAWATLYRLALETNIDSLKKCKILAANLDTDLRLQKPLLAECEQLAKKAGIGH